MKVWKVSKVKLIVLLIAVLLICLVGTVFVYNRDSNIKGTYTYFRISDKIDYTLQSYSLPDVIKETAASLGVTFNVANSYDSTQFLLFETLNNVDNNMIRIRYPLNVKFIYGVRGSDLMASKSNLALVLQRAYPKTYLEMIPPTYVLQDNRDIDKLRQQHKQGTIYILKKNIQRQEGYMLTNNLETILKERNTYVVCQEMLQNPYIVNGRKINLRVYLFVSVTGSDVTMSFYNNGFIYYTPEMFERNSMDPQKVITTGYIDRKVYQENPLTFYDLAGFLGSDKYNTLMTNITNLMKNLKLAYARHLSSQNIGLPGTKFLIYGCDIAPDENLNVTLMEINKGPDLSYKDDRDKKVKFNMVLEALSLVRLVKGHHENFVRL